MRIVAVFGILFSSIVVIRCSFLTLRRDKCTKLPPMCYQLINSEYTRMYLPNILNQSRYEDVVKELKVWKPLLNTTVCNARHQLKYFLCFTYAPVCVADHFIYTCQSFCRRLRDSCDPIMRSLNYSWPPFFDCNDEKKFRNNSTTMCISDAMLGLKQEECSCRRSYTRRALKSHICKSDFVISAWVPRHNRKGRYIHVKISRVFRQSSAYVRNVLQSPSTTLALFTAPKGCRCRRRLKQRSGRFLIIGRMESGRVLWVTALKKMQDRRMIRKIINKC
ncbi:secreted frizzled-related protein 2-like [Xenia sp. Carnegie-2017]|uniref:secreted frizzled-related protein 2-like n=1 Tax=Xenia sp. Carnegie-2017 TaxID=2897299 RepID=UPI001F03E5DE|nr:secreted frizzled-related protein 2-like [Xenia sp. Carnegie-2017]